MYIEKPFGDDDEVGKVESAYVDALGRLVISTTAGYMVLIDTDTKELPIVLAALAGQMKIVAK